MKKSYYDLIRQDEAIREYIDCANRSLGALGYTEHSFPHVTRVCETAGYILRSLDYDDRTVELARIAGYLHDIGNMVNRADHSQSGALISFRLLSDLGMEPRDIGIICSAIGNHDEGTGEAVNPVAAALIIADKSDVRRSRVRNSDMAAFDIHDRVNWSVVRSGVDISQDKKYLTLTLEIDPSISPVMDYFEIFLGRMKMCRRASEYLGLTFRLIINDQRLV